MNLVALIYWEHFRESGKWIAIPELKEWAKKCPGEPRYERPYNCEEEIPGSRFRNLIHEYNLTLRKPRFDIGVDLHPECILVEVVARCDVMHASRMPTFRLVETNQRFPLGLRWVLEDDESKSLRSVLDIVSGVDRLKRWFTDDSTGASEIGAHCDTGSLDFMRGRLHVAQKLVDEINEAKLAQVITTWCEEWLMFGAWFRKDYPESEPPPRSDSVEQIVEILDGDDLDIWNRYRLKDFFPNKAVQP